MSNERIEAIRGLYARHRELSGTSNITLSAQRACDLLDHIDKLEKKLSELKAQKVIDDYMQKCEVPFEIKSVGDND